MEEKPFRLLSMVDQKTRLAGSNKMELLLFSLGNDETYGINVFKVREVSEAIEPTWAPNMPAGVEGLISLRGTVLPVIDLARCLGVPFDGRRTKLIITEFSGNTQGFVVEDVARIVRVDWEAVKGPSGAAAGAMGMVTAITELDEFGLVMILDVEQILANVAGESELPPLRVVADRGEVAPVFFADDSGIARKRIMAVLDAIGVPYQFAVNGADAWSRLVAIAERAAEEGRPVRHHVSMVLTDAEMPEIDGYVLTRRIKSDRRFAGIPVLMHSSLSSVANRKLGESVGVDMYLPKFNAEDVAAAVEATLHGAPLVELNKYS